MLILFIYNFPNEPPLARKRCMVQNNINNNKYKKRVFNKGQSGHIECIINMNTF